MERKRLTKPINIEERREYYDLAPLQRQAAEQGIKPVAKANYIDVATMARCVKEWLVEGGQVIGWVHPVKGPQRWERQA